MKNKLSTLLLAGVATLTMFSCVDNDNLNENNGDNDALVSFGVNDVQTRAIAVSGRTLTRGAINPYLSSEDLAPQKLDVKGADAEKLCIIETTVEGVNPVQADAQTRANVIKNITENFSASGHRGTTEANITTKPEWFYNEPTLSNGKLVTPRKWSWAIPHARFYAVFPQVKDEYTKIKLSPETYEGSPYIEFEDETDVTNQKDLMTACSGHVHYSVQGTAPRTDLDFRHALTAIKFAVGQNLSINKTISKVEIRNALSKGKYTLSDKFDGTGAKWENLSDAKTFKLEGLAVSTNQNPNAVLTGNDGDNYTFYMIPQELTGKNITVYVEFTDGSKIESTLKGSWLAGTTKTYKLSEKNSTWEYTLETTNPANVAYNQDKSNDYLVTSYRIAPDGTKQPVKWKAVGFEEYDRATDSWTNLGTNKPTWLTAMSKENGEGGANAESGRATITKADLKDRLTEYNKVLQTATEKGAAGNYYNLSNTNGGDAIQNTANSYLISAPGYYRIPLVYGNAVKGGTTNESSYKTAHTGTDILSNFKDHLGNDITTPYINVQNASNPATQASIVWMDQQALVDGLSVTNNGDKSFVNFHVSAANIKNGNAVIAVKSADGTIMWSWHLWFDHSDALSTIACTNHEGDNFKVTKNILGYTIYKWKSTSYESPRVARMKIEQEVGNGAKKSAYITITQSPYAEREYSTALYQFGRKDAFPGTNTLYESTFVENGGNNISIVNAIQNPGTFYTDGNKWDTEYRYFNLWSMQTTSQTDVSKTLIKTIYDPCPVGFSMPPLKTFSGVTITGKTNTNNKDINALGDWDQGWHFYAKDSSSPSTVYYPAIGSRTAKEGKLYGVKDRGYYWVGVPSSTSAGNNLDIRNTIVIPANNLNRAVGCSIRPVAQ
ncbi:fimbrillin family protein [Prevotella melaninogenica]|jgi:conserved domain protein|uniref:fimbrillin family protein n=1 Tax=Prevotella melaninogenica TaxID=28132 RepID=UPI001D14488C|nr:fimbrillin family protein [Prevotella melaninogenica]UEA99767.1 fimbrillin family protein [Prevotella melaninogenica]